MILNYARKRDETQPREDADVRRPQSNTAATGAPAPLKLNTHSKTNVFVPAHEIYHYDGGIISAEENIGSKRMRSYIYMQAGLPYHWPQIPDNCISSHMC